MKAFSKPYHVSATLVLILFISSILFPVSLSAAGLCCELNITSYQTCCDVRGTNNNQTESSEDSCADQMVCGTTLTGDQIKSQAVVSHQASIVTILAVVENSLSTLKSYSKSPVIKPSLVLSDYSPPLFLLNSSFLI